MPPVAASAQALSGQQMSLWREVHRRFRMLWCCLPSVPTSLDLSTSYYTRTVKGEAQMGKCGSRKGQKEEEIEKERGAERREEREK